MTSKIFAGLFLSSMMVHAQAATPAQPQTAVAPVLQASLATPAMPMLSAAAANSADVPVAASERVSTGVTAPKLIHQVPMTRNTVSVTGLVAKSHEATISMIVDASGKPSELKIVQSAGSDLDASILETVSQYRYKPGTLDGQATAVPVNLHVVLDSGK